MRNRLLDQEVGERSDAGTADRSASRQRIVLGLGNPDERYAATRHNVGFRVIEELARRCGVALSDECNSRVAECDARVAECNTGVAECDARVAECDARVAESARAGEGREETAPPPRLLLAAPQTYMNRSGHAARCLSERRGLAAEDFLVVYDEIHLPLGTLRLRRRGSPAGHRGMESVLESLGTDRVPGLRLGVGSEEGRPGGEGLVAFVLAPFADSQRQRAEAMVLRAADACEAWAEGGVEAAMQRFNGPLPAD